MSKLLNWSEHKKPSEECRYDHITCETPLGKLVIEWKSWKDSPSYDISLGNDLNWIGCEYSLVDAQTVAETHLINKTVELIKLFPNVNRINSALSQNKEQNIIEEYLK